MKSVSAVHEEGLGCSQVVCANPPCAAPAAKAEPLCPARGWQRGGRPAPLPTTLLGSAPRSWGALRLLKADRER